MFECAIKGIGLFNFYFIYSGHLEVVEVLLLNGVDVNIASGKSNMPLHVAAANGNFPSGIIFGDV